MTISDEIKRKLHDQIWYIALNGCAHIKCKNCCLKTACPRDPRISAKFAMKVMCQAANKEGD